eukprot:scaffold1744_cov340-Prasinococcus_capsulatus_cf.AAC.3
MVAWATATLLSPISARTMVPTPARSPPRSQTTRWMHCTWASGAFASCAPRSPSRRCSAPPPRTMSAGSLQRWTVNFESHSSRPPALRAPSDPE